MSSTWRPSKAVKPETWGAFIEYATPLGVSISKLPPVEASDHVFGGTDFLVRKDATGELLYVPLPKDWTPDTVLRFLRAEHAARRLRIPMPHWTLTL